MVALNRLTRRKRVLLGDVSYTVDLLILGVIILVIPFVADAAPYISPFFAYAPPGEDYAGYPIAGPRSYFRPESSSNLLTLGRRPRALIPGSFSMFNEQQFRSHFRNPQQQNSSPQRTSLSKKSYTHQLKPTSATQPRINIPSIMFSDKNIMRGSSQPLLNSRQPQPPVLPVAAEVPQPVAMPPVASPVADSSGLPLPPAALPTLEFNGNNGPPGPIYGLTPMYTGIADGPGPSGPDGYPQSYQMDIVDPYSVPSPYFLGGGGPGGGPFNYNNNYDQSFYSHFNNHNNLQQRTPSILPQQPREPLDSPLSPQQNQIESEADRQANDFNWGVSNLAPASPNGRQFGRNYYLPQQQVPNTMLRNRFNFPSHSRENVFNAYRPDFSAPQMRQQQRYTYPDYFSNRRFEPQSDLPFPNNGFPSSDLENKNIYVKRYGNSPYDQSYEVKYGVTFPASSTYYSPPPPPPPEYMHILKSISNTPPAKTSAVVSKQMAKSSKSESGALSKKKNLTHAMLKNLLLQTEKRLKALRAQNVQ